MGGGIKSFACAAGHLFVGVYRVGNVLRLMGSTVSGCEIVVTMDQSFTSCRLLGRCYSCCLGNGGGVIIISDRTSNSSTVSGECTRRENCELSMCPTSNRAFKRTSKCSYGSRVVSGTSTLVIF